MAGKSLKTLSEQLEKNHGLVLVTTFDTAIVPGSVLSVKRWSDVTLIGHLKDGIPGDRLPPVEGPMACMLADFRRTHELGVNAALELIRPKPLAAAQFLRASEVVASFDSPVSYRMSLIAIEDALEATHGLWTKALGQQLAAKRTRTVFQVIRGKVTFMFRGSGRAGLDLRSSELGDLRGAGLLAGWSWRNEATLESKEEVVIAVEATRYAVGRRRFEG
jgi:hypothetical protein